MICDNCGRTYKFERHRTRFTIDNKHYCSYQCFNTVKVKEKKIQEQRIARTLETLKQPSIKNTIIEDNKTEKTVANTEVEAKSTPKRRGRKKKTT